MLRTLATTATSPAAVLTGVDHAFAVLGITDLTTAAVATPDTGTGAGAGAAALLRWSDAGHPPPVVICADGTTTLLQRRPQLLLGVSPDAARTDHQVALHPGKTVLLYTDGLIEHRGVDLDEGTAWLVTQLQDTHGRSPDQVCHGLLEGLAGQVDDDVALRAVRLERAALDR